jgi:AcrR family transcriptional regulator
MATDLKGQVLDASVQLIAEKGLTGLSMREVARRAGVSHQAPYHYFPDKAAIVAALVERGFTLLSEQMEVSAKGGTPQQRLERAGRVYVTFAIEQPVFFRLMFRPELTDLKRFPSTEAAGSRAFAVLEGLIDDRFGSRTNTARKRAMVSMYWSLVHGLSMLLLDGPLGAKLATAASRDRHVEQVLKLFVESTAT